MQQSQRHAYRLPPALFAFLAAATILAGLLTAIDTATAAERPNFIIMLADDVSWNDLGCYGHKKIKTPHLDTMAHEGMRFELAFLTCSSCSPSRCSILTGRYPHSTGAAELHQPLPADQVVFAGQLKKAGYYTAAAGKWHLGPAARTNFDRIEGGGPSGCENWVKVLKERPADKPFFLWLAAFDAHRGYAKNAIDKPHGLQDAVVPPYMPDAPAVREDLAMYYDEISRLDQYAGKVFAELKRQKIDNNTFVLFLADNGRPFPRSKTTVYDSGVRTPFIVRWPAGAKAGKVCNDLVSSVDIAPTILTLAGLPIGDTYQGVSFSPLLREAAHFNRSYVYAEHNWHDYQAHQRSVRSYKYLYIRNGLPQLPNTPPADAVRSPSYLHMLKLEAAGKLPASQRDCFIAPRPVDELYDVVADPHNMKNLAADPRYAATLQEMKTALNNWQHKTGDKPPINPTPDGFHRTKGTRLKK